MRKIWIVMFAMFLGYCGNILASDLIATLIEIKSDTDFENHERLQKDGEFSKRNVYIRDIQNKIQKEEQNTTKFEKSTYLELVNNKIYFRYAYDNKFVYMGRVKNVGSRTYSFVKFLVELRDSFGNTIVSDFTYIFGTNLTLTTGDMETGTCLRPGETGLFAFYVDTPDNTDAVYYGFEAETYATTTPDANLVIWQGPSASEDYAGNVDLSGVVKNTGVAILKFGIVFCSANGANSEMLDGFFCFIDGESIDGSNSALRVGHTANFDISILSADFSEYRSSECRTSWIDYGENLPTCTYSISPTAAHYGADGGPGNVTVSTSAGCNWQATTPVGWVIITDVTSTKVHYRVRPKPTEGTRETELTIAGKKFRISQDGDSSPPEPDKYTYLVVGLIHDIGSAGSVWNSTLTINRLNDDEPIRMNMVYRSEEDVVQLTVHVDGDMQVWEDPVVSLFGLDEGSGVAKISCDQPLHISVRTFNASQAGTFGQMLPAISADETIQEDQVALLSPVRRTEEFRTNLGAVNLGEDTATVEVEFFSDQYLGNFVFYVPAMSWKQVNDILRKAGVDEIENAYAQVEVLQGSNVWPYATLIDNISNDPSAILPVMYSP